MRAYYVDADYGLHLCEISYKYRTPESFMGCRLMRDLVGIMSFIPEVLPVAHVHLVLDDAIAAAMEKTERKIEQATKLVAKWKQHKQELTNMRQSKAAQRGAGT